MMRLYPGLALFALVSPASWAATAATSPRISGIYSDLAYNVEGGDLVGVELLVVPTRSDKEPLWQAFVQIAEGDAPFCAVVSLAISGAKVAFTLPPGGALGGLHFTGTISSTEIVLTTPGGQIEHLRRGKSYWQGT
jgi:hypothetical protein